jgi:hypothetical protein
VSIEVTCRCGKVLRAKDELAGKRVRCPQCAEAVLIEPPPELVDDVDVIEPDLAVPSAADLWNASTPPAPPNFASLNPLYPDIGASAAFGGQPMMTPLGGYQQPRSGANEQTVRIVAIVGGGITALLVLGFIVAVLLRPAVDIPEHDQVASKPEASDRSNADAPLPSPAQVDHRTSTTAAQPLAAQPSTAQDAADAVAADAAPEPAQTAKRSSSSAASAAASSGKWQDLGLALHGRQQDSQTLRGAAKIGDEPVMAGFSWMVELLPHLGHEAIYEKFDLSKSWSDQQNVQHTQLIVPEFLNPADPRKQWTGYPFQGMALSHFVGVSGLEEARNDVAATLPRNDPRAGVFGYDQIARQEEITDGTSQTVMIIGAGELASPWVQAGGATIRGAREPYFGPISGFGSRGIKEPGAQAAFADGSVRTISKEISPKVFRALVTIHGAETIDQHHLAAGSAVLDIKGQADGQPQPGRVEWQGKK